MFHLTPQERSVLAWLLCVFCVGTIVSIGLEKNVRLVRWADTVAEKPKSLPPQVSSRKSSKRSNGVIHRRKHRE